MKLKQQLTSLKPYQPGKPIEEVKREYGLENIVKLASNENPYGCSPNVKTTLFEKLEKSATYPDGYAQQLRTIIANHLDVSEKQLMFGNGSDELIQIICRGLLAPGKNTVMATPTFTQYKHNAIIENAEVREVPLTEDGDHNLQQMLEQIDEKTAVVWLCNPNNPTGNYINEQQLIPFLEKVPSTTLVVADEAYYEYVTEDDYPNSVALLSRFSNLFITRTFSKAYGLASFRLGYGISSEEVIRALEPVREPFNVNSFAQAAGAASIEDSAFVQSCARKNKEALSAFYSFCEEIGLKYYKSQGNFILIDFQRDGDEVFQYLLERGYIVRSGKALGFPTCVRITVGTPEQNEGLFSLITQFLQENV